MNSTIQPKENIARSPESKTASPNIVLNVLALAVAIVVIDGTVLNVSIKDITRDLGISLQDIQWAITLYSLIIASLTIFGSRIGDLWGRKRAFRIGAIIFGIGSLLTALSPNLSILLLGWSIIEGIGAALMIPASSALIVSNFEGQARGRAFALYGATAGVASAIGPILGGYLTTYFSWRWAFGINVVVVALLIAGSSLIKEYVYDKKDKITLDIPGVILSAIGLGTLTYGFIESSAYGWFIAKKPLQVFGSLIDLGGISITTYCVVIGIIMLAIFTWWELRLARTEGKEPLVNISIFKNQQFTVALGIIAFLFSGFTGILTFGVVLYYQSVLGLSAFDSGVGLIALSAATFIAAPLSARIGEKISRGRTVQIGVLLNLIAGIYLHELIQIGADRITLAPALFIFGIGFGLIISQITNLILSALPVRQAGEASGLNGTIREVGKAFGTAIIGAVFIASFASAATNSLNNKANIPLPAKQAIVKSLDDASSFNSTSNNACALPEKACTDIKDSFNDGTVAAAKDSIKVTVIFIAISFILSFFLPKKVFKPEVFTEGKEKMAAA